MLARMFGGDLPSRLDDQVREGERERGEREGRGGRSLSLEYALAEKKERAGPRPTHPLFPSPTPQGRVFIDRDPKHFRLILNWLRDGAAILPSCDGDRREVAQEAEFFQLASLAAAAAAPPPGAGPEPLTAAALRSGVAAALAADGGLRAALDVILACAFGPAARGGGAHGGWAPASPPRGTDASLPPIDDALPRLPVPPRSAAVDVTLREAAFCPLSPAPKHNARDEALYVGFRQEIRFEGASHCESYDAKHECHLLHEGGSLSYDHRAYGVPPAARHHVKAAHVCRHHCVTHVPPRAARLREAALTGLACADALAWALELSGFRGVKVTVHAAHAPPRPGPAAGAPPRPPVPLRRGREGGPGGGGGGAGPVVAAAAPAAAALLAAAPAAAAAAASAAASALSPRAAAAAAVPDPFADPEPVFTNIRYTVSLSL